MDTQSEKVIILGASAKPSRYAYIAATLLKGKGHFPILIGRSEGQVAGENILKEFPEIEVDTVTLYLKEEFQVQFIESIIKAKPKRVIFNPGTESNQTWRKLTAKNIKCIEACTLVMLRTGQY